MDKKGSSKNRARRKVELDAVSSWVEDGASVLDLGCGRGILLGELVRLRHIYAVGVDSDFKKISLCLKRGINSYHGDILDALSIFPEKSFDWIVCSRTLPELENASEVLLRALKVGKRVAVGFVNHAYWRNRLATLLTGDRIVNEVFPSRWESSRPINPISVKSFKKFCQKNDIRIIRSHFLRGDWERSCKIIPSLFAGYAIFEIQKD